MRYPRLGQAADLIRWASRLCEQLERDFALTGGSNGAGLTNGARIIKPAISAGAVTLDLSIGDIFVVTLTANLTTITVSGPPATGARARSFMVVFIQDGTGGRTVAFPAAWLWSGGGTPPTVTAAANARDRYQVDVVDGSYYADTLGQDYQ